jgi:hypothetical protein
MKHFQVGKLTLDPRDLAVLKLGQIEVERPILESIGT